MRPLDKHLKTKERLGRIALRWNFGRQVMMMGGRCNFLSTVSKGSLFLV
jgi:hypothetical protein